MDGYSQDAKAAVHFVTERALKAVFRTEGVVALVGVGISLVFAAAAAVVAFAVVFAVVMVFAVVVVVVAVVTDVVAAAAVVVFFVVVIVSEEIQTPSHGGMQYRGTAFPHSVSGKTKAR